MSLPENYQKKIFAGNYFRRVSTSTIANLLEVSRIKSSSSGVRIKLRLLLGRVMLILGVLHIRVHYKKTADLRRKKVVANLRPICDVFVWKRNLSRKPVAMASQINFSRRKSVADLRRHCDQNFGRKTATGL